MHHRITAALLTLVLLVLTSPACDRAGDGAAANGAAGSNADAEKAFIATHPRITQPSTGRLVQIVTADKSATLDPHNTDNGGDVKVINQIYETLIRLDPDDVNTLIPALATKWSVSDDGLTLTFTIREGVTFHDGAPLDATACKLSLDRLRGTYLDVLTPQYRSFYDFIDDVEAEGMTLKVKLNRPVARVALRNLSMFSASIISPRLLAATEGMETKQRSTFISTWASGTGPYYLTDYDPGSARVHLSAYGDYWDGAPSIGQLLFRQAADERARLESFASGEAHMLDDVPRPVWEQFAQDPDVKLHDWWALNICYLGVNVRHEKNADLRFRRAIQLAVDHDEIVPLYYGTARPTFSMVAQPLAEYDPNLKPPGTDEPIDQRRAAARQLIEEVGATGRSMTIYYPQDPRPYLPTPNKVADKLRQQLERIGLIIAIQAVPNAEYFKSIRTDKYELALVGWMSDNGDADNFYGPLTDGDDAGKPSTTNAGRTWDEQVHQWVVAAQGETDPQTQTELYHRIEKRLQQQIIGHVPLVNTKQGVAFRKELTGVEVDPLGHYRFHNARLAQ